MRSLYLPYALAALIALTPAAAPAQNLSDNGSEPPEDSERGLSLMERGAQMFMDGILREMAPALEDLDALAEEMGPALRKFAGEMGPKLAEVLDSVEDWSDYGAPRVLPNGDILIPYEPAPEDEGGAEPPGTETPQTPAPQIDL